MNLSEQLISARPSLSASSVKTYTSILRSLHKKVYGKDVEMVMKDFEDTDKILNHLEGSSEPSRRKSVLAALVVLTGKDAYRAQMNHDIRSSREETNKQTKTDTQRTNWVTQDEVARKYNEYKKMANQLTKKSQLSNADLQTVQNYIILALYTLADIRRSQDYVFFKIRNIDPDVDNYMQKNTFVFNRYKTAKTYGRQTIPIPNTLRNLIVKWSTINPTDYLLFDTRGNPLTAVTLNQRLNHIFDGKKVSVNALRHSFLTEKYGQVMAANKQMGEDMKNMGSSIAQAETYVKLD